MKRLSLRVAVVAAFAFALSPRLATADARRTEAKPIAPAEYESLKSRIQPQPGENRFWEIPWLLSIWEAREQAAEQGKPIYVWSGSQGAPITGC